MSENKFETVSSCVDNYIQQDESFDEIIKDSELSDTWGRYQLMGDIMRNDVPQTLQLDLSAKIAAAIDNEPTVLAPKNTVKKQNSFKARIVSFVKPLGQVAIAASAAGLMVLGVQQNNVVQTDEVAPIQNIQTSPFIGIAEPVSFNYQQPSKMSQKQAYIEQQRRLQALLLDHKQQIKLTAATNSEVNEVVEPAIETTPEHKVESLPK
ncbi:sigma-E factor negative regulatory protein [Pseudocolwellia agarivorans]|uniref:sigma-E factor negative regulatory protein n=1 Tax=Pseudocolwellia agarivorans TaxID=1911682 RepID=UPI00098557E5|nr:RseA family anti-sigma factor [Pseudocolwellia agarivorans]